MNIQERIQTLVEHLDKHLDDPTLKDVLTEKITFGDAVEEFYGIKTWLRHIPRAGIVREYDIAADDPEKHGCVPHSLVDIIDPFCERPLEREKLAYDAVRDDYRRWHATPRAMRRVAMGCGGLALSGIGAIGTIVGMVGAQIAGHDIAHNPAMIVGGLAAVVGGVWLTGYRVWMQPVPEETKYELKEFLTMREGGSGADLFIETIYRPRFMAHALESIR